MKGELLRIVLGVMPDIDTATIVCKTLFSDGCDEHRILLLAASSEVGSAEKGDHLSMRGLEELTRCRLADDVSAFKPAAMLYRGNTTAGTQLKAEDLVCHLSNAVQGLTDNGLAHAWSCYLDYLRIGKFVLAINISTLEKEATISKLILANSVGRFETISTRV